MPLVPLWHCILGPYLHQLLVKFVIALYHGNKKNYNKIIKPTQQYTFCHLKREMHSSWKCKTGCKFDLSVVVVVVVVDDVCCCCWFLFVFCWWCVCVFLFCFCFFCFFFFLYCLFVFSFLSVHYSIWTVCSVHRYKRMFS